MPPHPDTDQRIAELMDSKTHWANKMAKIGLVASTGDVRAVKPLARYLYVLAWNGYRETPKEFLQMMRDFVKSGEAKPAAEEVLAALIEFRDKQPGDPEEVGNMSDYRYWLAYALMELGEASVEPLIRELPNQHPNTTGYIVFALSKLGHGFEQQLQIFTTSEDEEILWQIAETLGNWNDKRAVQPLKFYFARLAKAMKGRTTDTYQWGRGRRGALDSLLKLGEVDFVCDTMRAYSTIDAPRLDVIFALASYIKTHPKDKKAIQTVEFALKDSNAAVVHTAKSILAGLKRP
jgi:hypothetical protein